MGRILGMDDSIEKESQFIDIPEGEYDAIIDHYEEDRCQWNNDYNGNPMIVVYVNIMTPTGESQLRENFVLNSDYEWKLSQLFLATGQKRKGEPLPNLGRAVRDLPGTRVRVKIVKTKGKGENADKTYTNMNFLEKKPAAGGSGWSGGF